MRNYNKYDIIIRDYNKDICLYLYTNDIKYVLIFGKILHNINNESYFSFNHDPKIVGIRNDNGLASEKTKSILFNDFTSKRGLSFIEKANEIIDIDLLQLDEYINYLKQVKINKFNL